MDNIKLDLKERGWDGTDWIHLALDREQWRALVSAVINLQVTENAGKLLRSCTTGGCMTTTTTSTNTSG
jgi:hypothetical protein